MRTRIFKIEVPSYSNCIVTASLLQELIAEDSMTLKPAQVKVTEIYRDDTDEDHPNERPHRG